MRFSRFDKPLKAYSLAWTTDAEGIRTPTLTLAYTFYADLQPLVKTASRRAEYGLDSTEAKAMQLFYDSNVILSEGMVIEDGSTRYMVSGPPNLWPSHSEAVMVAWNGS